MASLNVVISLESFSSKATSKNIGELVLHLAHIVSRKFIVTLPLSLQPALFLLLAHWHPGEDQDTLLPECFAKHLLKDLIIATRDPSSRGDWPFTALPKRLQLFFRVVTSLAMILMSVSLSGSLKQFFLHFHENNDKKS